MYRLLFLILVSGFASVMWAQGVDTVLVSAADSAEAIQLRQADNYAWTIARDSNTVSAYESYLRVFSQHATEAQQAITVLRDEQAWKAAVEINSQTYYEAYLSAYTLHAGEARARLNALLDEQVWGFTRITNTREAYEKYLATYSKYADEAREWIRSADDDALWAKVLKSNTISSIQEYFDQGGINHVEEAVAMSARIDRQMDMIDEAETLFKQKQYQAAFDKVVESEQLGKLPEYLRMRALVCKEMWAYQCAARTKSQQEIRDYLTTYKAVATEKHMSAIQARKKK